MSQFYMTETHVTVGWGVSLFLIAPPPATNQILRWLELWWISKLMSHLILTK